MSIETPPQPARALLPDSFLAAIATHYELERELGAGGMAVVWLARHRGEQRRVALKVLRPVLAEAVAAQRFLREIRIAGTVTSPALLPLIDSGEAAGLPYYVMPYVEGGSLRDRLRRDGHLRISDAVAITRHIATALSSLHRGGFVHRDIKPENVLLGTSGEAFLADYGVAHAVTTSALEDFSSTGIVVGTPHYMSPEQGGGLPVDRRSDLYSLGCMLYEMLMGEAPFHGNNPHAVIVRHMHEAPPSMRVVRATIPEELEAITMRLLAKIPADRFDDADELIAVLDQLGDLRASTTTWPGVRRRRPVRAMIGGVIAAVAAGAALLAMLRPPELDPNRVVIFPFEALGARDPAVEQASMLVGSALERAATTTWIDGHTLLSAADRTAGTLATARLRALAKGQRARHYITGTVARSADSTVVQVRLHDVRGGLLLDSRTESGAASAAMGDLVLRAVVGVLPRLTGVASVVDVSGMVGRNPAAVDNWLRGEREYRRSRPREALRLLELAVAADSQLSPAAYRAAAAAHWVGRPDEALVLIQIALRNTEALSERQRRFASALERFLNGRGDEALSMLRPLLTRETESPDAWMLAGEVYLHLLPTIAVDPYARTSIPAPREWPLEDMARAAFERARAIDTGYTPPLAHLAEMAARRADVDSLARLQALLARESSDTMRAIRLTTAERCLRDGPGSIEWAVLAKRHPETPYHVGFMLRGSANATVRQCAIAAFTASLAADSGANPTDWLSFVALHGFLVANRQDDRALQLVDSAINSGIPAAVGIYVLDREAGIDPGTRDEAFAAELLAHIDSRRAPSLWLLALRAARTKDTTTLRRVSAALARRRATPGDRIDSLLSTAATAYLARERGDTTNALRIFAGLRPTAVTTDMYTSLWESLGPERLAHAELLLQTGNAAEAHRVASTFDQPDILIHELFLRRSLEIRERAAMALRDSTLAARARERLASMKP